MGWAERANKTSLRNLSKEDAVQFEKLREENRERRYLRTEKIGALRRKMFVQRMRAKAEAEKRPEPVDLQGEGTSTI